MMTKPEDTLGISTMGDIYKDGYEFTSIVAMTVLKPHYAESLVAIVTSHCALWPVGVKSSSSTIAVTLNFTTSSSSSNLK